MSDSTVAIGKALKQYLKAARGLLQTKYAHQNDLAPSHLRELCNVSIFRCSDGTLVRYDKVDHGEGEVRCGDVDARLYDIVPLLSEQFLHVLSDGQDTPNDVGREIVLFKIDNNQMRHEIARIPASIYITGKLSDDFEMPPPPARPPYLVSLQNEFDLRVQGIVLDTHASAKSQEDDPEQFITNTRLTHPVGWQAIEIQRLA